MSGDVFKFVMELEKSTFPEAVRSVAEKCGIAIPDAARTLARRAPRKFTARGPDRNASRSGGLLLRGSSTKPPKAKSRPPIWKIAVLNREAMTRFGLGFAPSAGDALLRHLKSKYPEKLLEVSGLFSRDQGGRLYDKFRRRIMFPIANESGKVIAFGGRAMGDDMPKYMNSPETPIYTKSSVLYHLDRAKEALRQT